MPEDLDFESTEDTAEGSSDGDEASTQENQDDNQSEGEQTTQETYEIGGQKLTAQEVIDKYNALEKDYSRKSNRLSEYEKKIAEISDERLGSATTEGISSEIAEKYPADVREAVKEIVMPDVQKIINNAIQQDRVARERLNKYERGLERLEQNFDGEDGKPKFDASADEDDLYGFMQDKGLYDVEAAYKIWKEDEIADWRIKQAMESKKGSVKTERTSGGKKTPQPKKPTKTFKDARKAATELLRERGL